MQTFLLDMKDGVPLRDRIGVEFDTDVEAIEHSRVLAQHFRDESLRDDQDLEISVVNAQGREIHREHAGVREPWSAAPTSAEVLRNASASFHVSAAS